MKINIIKLILIFLFTAIFLLISIVLFDLAKFDSSYINKNSLTFSVNNLNSKTSKNFFRYYDNLYHEAQLSNLARRTYMIICIICFQKKREEELAKEHLERQSYQVYLPKILGRKRQSGRTIRVIQPMFPRYLFINLSDETDDWGPIRSTIGVSTLVRFGMEPAKVPENLIKYVQKENTKFISVMKDIFNK